MQRRTLVQALAGAALPALGQAQTAPWPSRPIRIITPQAPGGSGDVMLREFATRLAERLGQPVVVDNRPGANGIVATQAVARAPADGYTLLWTLTQHIQVPVQTKNAGYDPIEDFTPIARIGAAVTLLVARPALGIKSAADLVSQAPGKKWSFGSTATGPQVVLEAFNKGRNLNMLSVPYKGEAPAIQDLLGGQIDIALFSVATARPFVLNGQLVPLGISATRRAASLPDLPTFQEQGYADFNWIGWYGFMGPAKLPPAIATRLTAEIKAILETPEVARKLDAMDIVVNWADGPAFLAGMKQDTARWASLVQRSGVTFD
ncbi:MAG: tripartite tricarboxylate transporter substrate binding protein [Rhodoferax sp.]|nr:tripartite tricarboxylate transporter substrate binding protein [Rhodoferax sp.]